MDVLQQFLDELPAIITALTTIVASANAITAVTPSKTNNETLNRIQKVLNILALNIGRNKNADDY